MRLLICETTGKAHEAVIAEILRDGEQIVTEDGETTMEYPEPIAVHINKPLADPRISPACMFKGGFLSKYIDKVCDITPFKGDGTDAVYTYGNRLRDYPIKKDGNERGNGRKDGIDQLPRVIAKLKNNYATRRAIMHTWHVETDLESPEPPCVQTIQFFTRAGKLNMVVYIRSNDMLSAYGANVFALATLQKKVAGELGMEVGWLETISASAHIYDIRDREELDKFRRVIRG